MNTQAKVIIGALVALAAGLGIAAGVMAAGNDDHSHGRMGNHMGGNDNGYQSMMGAMASMDSDDMLTHMRDVLGQDAYQRMLAHMADHQGGTPMSGNSAIDQMMHTMMDEMMGQKPMDRGNMMAGPSRARLRRQHADQGCGSTKRGRLAPDTGTP
jgi:hypothetical protein